MNKMIRRPHLDYAVETSALEAAQQVAEI